MTGILAGVVAGVLAWIVFAYNGLVRLRNQVRTAWADIDVQLRRRHDLVPQLVSAVKGYAGYERVVLTTVTSCARRRWRSEPGKARRNRDSAGERREAAAARFRKPILTSRRTRISAASARPGRGREPPSVCAALLQRRCPRLQHGDRALSRHAGGERGRICRDASFSAREEDERAGPRVELALLRRLATRLLRVLLSSRCRSVGAQERITSYDILGRSEQGRVDRRHGANRRSR